MDLKFLSTEEDEPPSRCPEDSSNSEQPPDVYQDYFGIPSLRPAFRYQPAVARRNRKHLTKFPINPRTDLFRKRYFPGVLRSEWNDWHWQLRNRFRDLNSLARILDLSPDEMTAVIRHTGTLPVAITPYYASLMDRYADQDPLRRSMVPVNAEYVTGPGESEDPLSEDDSSPVPGLVHRYPDRVLFLVANSCAAHCRYCTRSRMICMPQKQGTVYRQWEQALDYIRHTPVVRDVLISGGDPLILSDEKLSWILESLRAIPHVELIRIGTKAPVVMPQRITPALVRMLRRYHPLWMSIHFTHPNELTEEVAKACSRLADAGIPLGSQTVLLAGINDDADTMMRLMHGLLSNRVKPYYLFQCDPIKGSSHFRTPVQKGLDIIKALRGFTSGYAVPAYVIDAPGGGGKIPLLPDYLVGRDGDEIILQNYQEKLYRYPDTAGENASLAREHVRV